MKRIPWELVIVLALGWLIVSCATTGPSTTAAGTTTPGSVEVSGGVEQLVLNAVDNDKSKNAEAFGWSVSASADGSTVVVSSPYWGEPDQGLKAVGRAFIFERKSGKWTREAVVCPLRVSSLFGASTAVSADGKTVVVGAPGLGPTDKNGIFLYLRSKGDWAHDGLYPHWMTIPGEIGSKFGDKIALSGDGGTILIGSPAERGHGRARYLVAPSVGWAKTTSFEQVKMGYLGVANPQVRDEFGESVAISADDTIIAIGAPGRNNAKGAVYVFEKPAAGWIATKTLFPIEIPGGQSGDRFGQSVSVSRHGSKIVVGASGAHGKEGAIYLISYEGGGKYSWRELSRNSKYKEAGISVGISADGKVVASGSLGEGNGGSVRIVESATGDWSDEQLIGEYASTSDAARGSLLGFSVDVTANGKLVFAGAPLYQSGTGDWAVFAAEKK